MTCASGWLHFRLYDDGTFYDAGSAVIQGYQFEAYVDVRSRLPDVLSIRYSIEAD